MNLRTISSHALSVLLVGSLTGLACDGGDAKKDVKADAKKADDEKAADLKADGKAEAEAKAEDAKAEDAKADAAEGEDDAGDAEDAAAGGAEGADDTAGAAPDAKADDDDDEDDDDDDEKADDEKADDEKADAKKADDKKADAKKADAKKADDKKPDDKKPDDAGPSAKIDAKDIFGKKCKSCHGASGDAKTKLGEKHKIDDWTQPGWKAKWSKAKIVEIVTHGEAGTKMKAFKDKLSKEEIDAVADYCRKLGK